MKGGLPSKVGSVEICRPKLTMEFEADSIDEVLRQVGYFLKGCSYEFNGEIGILESEDFEYSSSTDTKGNSE